MFGFRNSCGDFQIREKVLPARKIGKRFQVENQGFRGFREREKRTKFESFRLDLRVESGTRTEEREETWH